MNSTPHLSSFRLDALALGALPQPELAVAEAHLSECDHCRGRADRARASRDGFARRMNAQAAYRRLEVGAARAGAGSRWRWAWAFAVALAVAVAVVAPRLATPHQDTLGIKGGPTVQAFARRGTETFRLSDGMTLHPQDGVRFAVVGAGHPYLMVASIDSARQANVYFPFGGEQSGVISPDGVTSLPGSLVLDDTLGPERVYLLFSREPLAAGPVKSALLAVGSSGPSAIRTAHELPLAGVTQVSLEFEKVDR
jgi:hypothetical protein